MPLPTSGRRLPKISSPRAAITSHSAPIGMLRKARVCKSNMMTAILSLGPVLRRLHYTPRRARNEEFARMPAGVPGRALRRRRRLGLHLDGLAGVGVVPVAGGRLARLVVQLPGRLGG